MHQMCLSHGDMQGLCFSNSACQVNVPRTGQTKWRLEQDGNTAVRDQKLYVSKCVREKQRPPPAVAMSPLHSSTTVGFEKGTSCQVQANNHPPRV